MKLAQFFFLDPTGDGVEVGSWEEDEKSLE